MKKSISGRGPWLACTVTAAALCALLRRWQLSTAFEGELRLPIPWAAASVVLVCVLVISGAALLLLSAYQPVPKRPWRPGQAHRWDRIFLDSSDMVYPILVVAAGFLALGSVPVLAGAGVELWRDYRAAVEAHIDPLPTNNGVLLIAAAVAAVFAFFGLLQLARNGLRPGHRSRDGFSAALPGLAGCIWLMESFRAHAADPVLWDYAPQMLAIMCGMLFYMDYAGMSGSGARPRRLLWLAGMTVVLSAVSLVSAAAELSALVGVGGFRERLGDVLLLLSQMAAALAVLWRLPPNLENPPQPMPDGTGPEQEQEEQEETTHE